MSPHLAGLSPEEKRDLLARALRNRAQPTVVAPLSFNQRRLWLLDQLEAGTPFNNLATALRIRGVIHVNVIQQVLNEFVRRHESLRTTFRLEAGEPVQVVSPPHPLPMTFIDLTELAHDEQEHEIRRLAREEARTPMDLTTGPLIRVTLLRRRYDEHVGLVTIHHIIADGWSMGVFLRELGILYGAFSKGRPSPLPELPIQYRDYAEWQRQKCQGRALEDLLSYWKEQLQDAPHIVRFRADRPRPAVMTSAGAAKTFSLPTALSESIKELSKLEGVTPFMTLLAAFGALLYRHTDQETILIGTPITGRERPETQDLIGFLVNTLVLRIDFLGRPTFRHLLGRIRETALGAIAHQEMPFDKLVEELRPPRDVSRHPLVQVMFAFQNAPLPTLVSPDLSISLLELGSEIARFDLALEIFDQTHGMTGRFEYRTDLFDEATIDRLARHYQDLLHGIASNPDQRISQAPLLTASERRQLLVEWNATRTAYPEEACLHHLFEAQVERTPEAVAVIFGGESLTYRELNERANQLAHHLRTLSVGPEVLVGVCMERSTEMVIGLLGILKAGGAYVPLDPSHPKARLAFMLEDARVSILLTEQRLASELPPHTAHALCLDALPLQFSIPSSLSKENPPSRTTARNVAYVIYTSGSTGRPKGVMVEHRSVVNVVTSFIRSYHLSADDRVLQQTSLSFDVSVNEIFPILSVGGTVVFPGQDDMLDFEKLTRLMAEHRVSILGAVPSVLARLNAITHELPHVRLILSGGETLSATDVDKLIESATVINGYGPTETTVCASCYDLSCYDPSAGASIPIGKPLANYQIYILDEDFQCVPIGCAGELCIGGPGVARGYLNAPELTAEKFVPNPYVAGERLFRSGDLARWLPDGNIEFLGRADWQVKLRGQRIELEEIEAILRQHPAVADAVVVVHSDEAGEKLLAGYVVPREPAESSDASASAWLLKDLAEFLHERLPECMAPSRWMVLKKLPRTTAGKVDRAALPVPARRRAGQDDTIVPPRTPIEEVVADIWVQILSLDRISIHDNFFHLGGHSLLAAQVVSRLRQMFQVDLPLRSLFESPTVAGLAERIEKARREGEPAPIEPIQPAPRLGPLPLSFGQQGLWFIDQIQPGVPFHIPVALYFTGALDVRALEQSLNEVVRRHESLRTTFAPRDGQPVQVISEDLTLSLPECDLSGLEETDRRLRIKDMMIEGMRQPFDLTCGPLLRATLWRLNNETHVLFVVMHHIISDGWSIGVFVREVQALYQAVSLGAPSPLPDLPIQFADYAYWQRHRLSDEGGEHPSLTYWKDQLAAPVPVLELPTDFPRPAVPKFRGATRTQFLPDHLVRSLKDLSRREGTTLFMTLLAAFATFLYRYTEDEDIIIGTPVANRMRVEIEGLIGSFSNLLALRTNLSGDPTFREVLGRVREVALGAYAHQEFPYEKLIEILHPERSLSQTPLFRVMFMLEHHGSSEVMHTVWQILKSLKSDMVAIQEDLLPAAFDLILGIAEFDQQMAVSLHYRTDLFEASTIDRMLGCFRTLLEGVVADANQRITLLPLLDDEERQRLLVEWNATNRGVPHDRCLHTVFEAQVKRNPDRLAVVFEGQQLSYAELNQRANQVAHTLRRLSVGPEVRVGICMKRSPEMVIGLLGILKAGGAYVPLDPFLPAERRAFMLQDAHVSVVLTEEQFITEVQSDGVDVVALDSGWGMIAEQDDQDPLVGVIAENLAYVIYTSGTTGVPNGVLVSHRAVVNHNTAVARRLNFQPTDRVLQFASISFDAAVEEIFGCLAVGATLVLRTDSILDSMDAFLRGCHELNLTILDLPTVFWHELAAEMCSNNEMLPESLRLVIIGGERALPERVDAWRQRVGSRAQLVNTYGPTEATVVATMIELAGSETEPAVWPEVPIGRPIDNVQVYALDRQLQPVPIGVPGELYIGGMGLARGYLNRPNLTAERFVPNPFSPQPGARLYKTGDRVRYRADGRIEFLGRTDDQIKLRGFRIELKEIESRLRHHPLVSDALVILREDQSDEKRLVAYTVPKRGSEVGFSELRQFLQQQLPNYMIPSRFILLDALPLTPRGKVDRQALPSPSSHRPHLDEAYVAPRNEDETRLAYIWSELLKVNTVGVHDNFFALGGHSLLAVQVTYRVREAFHVDLPVRLLFESPTVAQLVERIHDLRASPELSAARAVHETSSLVAMHTSRGGPRVFCLHPVGGQIYWYKHLARALAEQCAVYGVQSRALADPAREHPTLTSMADEYARLICAHPLDEPLHLLGWSSGGLLALAVGGAIEKRGGRVSSIGLIDTYFLTDGELAARPGSARHFVLTLCEALAGEHSEFARVWEHVADHAASLAEELLPLSDEERLEALGDWLERMNLAGGDFRDVLKQRLRLFNAHHALLKAFQPSRLHTSFSVFWAQEPSPGLPATASIDWSEYTSVSISTQVINGNHFSLLRPPAVQVLAERLATHLKTFELDHE
jgi:amino acid adenylation domain-containing protein